MKKSLAIRALNGLSAALLCCCASPALGGVMLVDFQLPEGVEVGDSLSGGPDGAAVANSSSPKEGAAGGASSGGSGDNADGSAQGSSSSAGSSGGGSGSGGSGAGSGSGPSNVPTQSTDGTANNVGSANNGGTATNGGTTPPAAGQGTGNGGVGPGGEMLVTDPVVLVSHANGGGDNQPSVSTDPTFSYMPPLSVVAGGGESALSPLAANLDDLSAAVAPGASAPEASAVIIWAVLGTAAAFGCKLRRRSAR